jgi:predicted membrane channel-forming protein YqfA (hemolysin III family)
MTIPKNVLRFEILSYLSLAAGLAGAALADDGSLSRLNIFTFVFVIQLIGVVVVAVCWMIYLAARKRKGWTLWIVAGWQALNVLSIFARNESPPELVLVIISIALGVLGLYFACSDDAKEWFKPTQVA